VARVSGLNRMAVLNHLRKVEDRRELQAELDALFDALTEEVQRRFRPLAAARPVLALDAGEAAAEARADEVLRIWPLLDRRFDELPDAMRLSCFRDGPP
jgi:hypothetical protein